MATNFELETGSRHHQLITRHTVITSNWEINRYNSKDIHGGVSLTPSRIGYNESRFGAPLPPDCDECMTWYKYDIIEYINIDEVCCRRVAWSREGWGSGGVF